MKKIPAFLFIIMLAFGACKKAVLPTSNSKAAAQVDKIAPDGFVFNTTKVVTVNLTLKSVIGGALPNVLVRFYLPDNTDTNAAIFKAVTDKSGKITASITVPASVNVLLIDPTYAGLLHNAHATITTSNTITASLGGPAVFSGDIAPDALTSAANTTSALKLFSISTLTLSYPSPYTSTNDAVVNTTATPVAYGIPKYLEPIPDVINQSLFDNLSATLPEGGDATVSLPYLFTNTAAKNLSIFHDSDVWITFVSETSSSYNSLAFYSYPTNNPPQSTADIKNATLIFPNASSYGSGGGLKAGDRVKIGSFKAGTSIGFVLLQDAWRGSNGLITNGDKFYTDPKFNPETQDNQKQHSVMLYDDVNKAMLFGFEDHNRQTDSVSGKDFNDLVFYAKSDPENGISTSNVRGVITPQDSDGDGVPNYSDEWPYNPDFAYSSSYPSENTWATIAFEDNWPTKGDYDMNDLVVNYRYHYVISAQNRVALFDMKYTVAAVGASFKNGFGIQFNVAPSSIGEEAGLLEKGQSKAVFVLFNSTDKVINNPDNSYFINTQANKYKTDPVINLFFLDFWPLPDYSAVAPSQINPFLISNGRRGYEVHLPGYAPTDLADPKLFGASDDASVPALSKYYISKENGPWAINFSNQFVYPVEGVNINDAYKHFAEWAKSGGSLYKDWYSNTSADYRNSINLYLK